MVEKRIVTKGKGGEVLKIVEHHNLDDENRQKQIDFRFGFVLGVLATVLVFGVTLLRFARF